MHVCMHTYMIRFYSLCMCEPKFKQVFRMLFRMLLKVLEPKFKQVFRMLFRMFKEVFKEPNRPDNLGL